MNVLYMRLLHTMPDMWCKGCNQFKPYDQFYSLGNGKSYKCKDCFKKQQREKRKKMKR